MNQKTGNKNRTPEDAQNGAASLNDEALGAVAGGISLSLLECPKCRRNLIPTDGGNGRIIMKCSKCGT